jgi:16S rRNA (adenine1518-N6/adenine1519-N6)-dimethyltransferase
MPRRHPKKRLGQHFFRYPHLMEEMLDLAGIGEEEVVVELGAGTGVLTLPLARRVKRILAVELDPELIGPLEERLKGIPSSKVTIVQGDLLKLDFSSLAREMDAKITVVGNIPYQLTSPILFMLLDQALLCRRALLTIQKEVGERLLGVPGTRAYGILTVLVSYQARIQPIMDLPAQVFKPKPKVDSMALLLDFTQPHPKRAQNEDHFKRVVKAAFSQRRKTIHNSLKAFAGESLAGVLNNLGIDPQRRPETLTLDEFIQLSDRLSLPHF